MHLLYICNTSRVYSIQLLRFCNTGCKIKQLLLVSKHIANGMASCTGTKRRMRRPHKKWTMRETKIILNYLQEAEEIEMPTAQIFYRKLIQKSGIDATWDILRWKVRHLKTMFKKANDWKNTIGAQLLEADADVASVEAKVFRICPHYKQLYEIFGRNPIDEEFTNSIWDNGDNATTTDIKQEVINEPMADDDIYGSTFTTVDTTTFGDICTAQNNGPSPIPEPVLAKRITPPAISKKDTNYFNEKTKKTPPTKSLDRTAMFKMKFELEKERLQNEFVLNERKVKLEEEKTKAEIEFKKEQLELRRLELEKSEKIRILEIEMEERLKKYEIEMKYKVQ